MKYGCRHYRKRCKIRAPCCNEIFDCHRCHNESTNELHDDIYDADVKQVICSICYAEQPAAQICTNCGVKMAEYFCKICKCWEDDVREGIYHCNDCGICYEIDGNEVVHCEKCGCCRGIDHECWKYSARIPCPICYEDLVNSYGKVIRMRCGHHIHLKCFDGMSDNGLYKCPYCLESIMDMSDSWKDMDDMIHSSQVRALRRRYRKKVWILCNDCHLTCKVRSYIICEKCEYCGSFNTRKIAKPPESHQ